MRAGAEVRDPRLVFGQDSARAREVETLRDREAHEVVAHLHHRVCLRRNGEGERSKEQGEEVTSHSEVWFSEEGDKDGRVEYLGGKSNGERTG